MMRAVTCQASPNSIIVGFVLITGLINSLILVSKIRAPSVGALKFALAMMC
jgi:hypothetical protein